MDNGARPFRGNKYMNADGTPRMPEPKPALAAVDPIRHEPETHWIAVDRIVVKPDHGVQLPGPSRDAYPHTETTLRDDERMGAKRVRMWLDTERGEFVLENPKSGCREYVPIHNVKQYRRAP